MPGHERIIVEVRIGPPNSVDLLGLAWSKGFLRIEAPSPFQQSLATQHLVDSGDAAG
jgi:hypothetical protein